LETIKKRKKYLIVKTKSKVVRAGPHKKYKKEAVLKKGMKVLYIAKKKGWYCIMKKDGKMGWVNKKGINFLEA